MSRDESEFNLVTPQELFSYEAMRNNLALNGVQNLAIIFNPVLAKVELCRMITKKIKIQEVSKMLITNVNIITEKIPCGYINVEDDVITDVGYMENCPSSNDVYDGKGCFAVPGFIDAHTHLYNNDYGYFDKAFNCGITLVAVSPDSSKPVGGEIKLVSTKTKETVGVCGIKLALGENPSKNFENATEIVLEEIEKAESAVFLHVHSKEDIDLVKGKNVVFVHGTDCQGKCRIIAGPMLTDISKKEMEKLSYENLVRQYKEGSVIAICSDHPETPVDFLQLYAQLVVKYGVDKDDALLMITKNPAQLLGVDDCYGSIKINQKGGVLIFDRHPMDFYSRLIKIL